MGQQQYRLLSDAPVTRTVKPNHGVNCKYITCQSSEWPCTQNPQHFGRSKRNTQCTAVSSVNCQLSHTQDAVSPAGTLCTAAERSPSLTLQLGSCCLEGLVLSRQRRHLQETQTVHGNDSYRCQILSTHFDASDRTYAVGMPCFKVVPSFTGCAVTKSHPPFVTTAVQRLDLGQCITHWSCGHSWS